MQTIVDIDFDFFVRESLVLDWGHSEHGPISWLSDVIWQQRIIGATSQGINLNTIVSPPGLMPHTMWRNLVNLGFNFTKSDIAISDSHADTGQDIILKAKVQDDNVHIIHIDAHHDLGYHDVSNYACDNWLRFAAQLDNVKKITIVYPNWRKFRDPLNKNFKLNEITSEDKNQFFIDFKQYNVEIEFIYWSKLITSGIDVYHTALCRSGSWTPPWLDKSFARLVNNFPGKPYNAVGNWQGVSEIPIRWHDEYDIIVKKMQPMIAENKKALKTLCNNH